MARLAILSARFACFAILSAFGGDAVGAVLGAGAAAFGHHGGALGAVVQRRVGLGGGHAADRVAQTREEQGAARGVT